MATLKTLRVDSAFHRQASLAAMYEGKSLKQFLEDAIAFRIQSDEAMAEFVKRGLEANATREEGYQAREEAWHRSG